MADSKITALTAISTVDPTADPLVIVDVSDTSMAASGTTKKSTINQLLGAGGTATLASATITGDLTVDTSTLKVDSTNNRVGIVNATPSFTLDVNGAGSSVCARISSGSGTGFRFDTTRNVGGLNRNYLIGPDILNEGWFSIIPSTALGGGTFTNSIYNASSDGIHAWNNGAGAELMRLNTTGNLVLKGGTAGATGVGLTFPATQVASSDANCLDDYEEGTWTGTLAGGTTNPTTPVTATGRYTKIGRQVYVQISFQNVDTTGASGSASITGLPFTSAAGALGSVASYSMLSFTGSLVSSIGSSEAYISFLASSSASTWNAATHSAGSTRFLVVEMTYTV